MLTKFTGTDWCTNGFAHPLHRGAPRIPRRRPGSEARGPGAAAEVAAAVGPAFYPKRSIKPDSQRRQAALPARRRGIAGHLLPPIGGQRQRDEGEWGEGGEEGESSPTPDLKREDAPAEGLQDDNGQVPRHAHGASAGAPNLPVAAGDPGSSWSPPRVPPAPGGGRALQGRRECGREGRRPWLRSPSQLAGATAPPSPRSRAAAGAEWPVPGGSETRAGRPLPACGSRRGSGTAAGPAPPPRGLRARRAGAAAAGRRRKARHGHGHGRRRGAGGSAGSGGEGRPRPARPRAPGPGGARRSGAEPRRPRRAQARMAAGQVRPRPRAWWGEAVPTRVCPAGRLPLAHSEPLRPRRPGSGAGRSCVCHLQDPGANPSLPASRDFPDGAMLSFQDDQGSSPPGDPSRRPPPEIPRRFPPCPYRTGNASH
ncbi:collagen alpha-1(I) chain-like [Diceros bicornis minor]|uniref:collagen alpha-1(I) chain-like n=1 Tax=Diceros bicornis minor TaxID=77932 RepID=UPI0026EB8AA2|nr:collagen alpha-1(I) chain-like [Diceros bicornis minor]